MADIKLRVPVPVGGCTSGARGHRGHRGPRGHDANANVNPATIDGDGSSADPFNVINVASSPLVPLGTRQFIFARLTGNDATGDGSLSNPYRTLQRAVLDVPLFIPPNLQIVVDISDLGLETLPQDYALPPITQGAGPDRDFSNTGPAAFQANFLPLTIYAEPLRRQRNSCRRWFSRHVERAGYR
jgi:hypothetical protein